MKIYFQNPKTKAIRERICDISTMELTIKEESMFGYTKIFKEVGADLPKKKLTETAYFKGHTLFIKGNWSITKNIEQFAPAIEFSDSKTEKSTHTLEGKFFEFPAAKVEGTKYAFVEAFEKYGNIKFKEIDA